MAVKKREKDLTFLERIYIPEIVKALSLTMKNMFKPKFTMKYPEEKFIPPASYRGRPFWLWKKTVRKGALRADSVPGFVPLWP